MHTTHERAQTYKDVRSPAQTISGTSKMKGTVGDAAGHPLLQNECRSAHNGSSVRLNKPPRARLCVGHAVISFPQIDSATYVSALLTLFIGGPF